MFRVYRGTLCWILVVVMAVSPSLVYAQPPQTSQDAKAEAKQTVDLSYVTPGTALAVVAHPRRVLTAPEMEMLPIEIISAAGKQELGIDPVDIEQILLVAEPPQAAPPPEVGIVVRFSKPYSSNDILQPLRENTVEGDLDGVAYRQGQGPMDLSFYMPDEKTLLVGTDAMLRAMVANRKKPKSGSMSKLLGKMNTSHDLLAVLTVEPIREMVVAQLSMLPVPPPFEGFKKVPELLSVAAVRANFTGKTDMALVLRARDEAAAKELDQLIDQAITLSQQMILAHVAEEFQGDDPVEKATAQYVKRINKGMFEGLRPERKGNRLEFSSGSQQPQIATIGILVALLLPAIQAARAAARRAASMNNLKQIGLTMLNHQETYGTFPARATFDEDGKPLLSWRVHVLPFIEENALYKRFKLDEPWDSPHNKKLIPLMPDIYRSPVSKAEPHKTTYLVPVGEGTIFEGDKGLKIADIGDGTSRTILALEANDEEAVIWTQPDDWQYDPQEPLSGLGRAHIGGFIALFADASVHFIAASIDPDVFRALMSVDGGEDVPRF